MSLFRRAPKDPNRCRIDEDTGAYGSIFIGRQFCSTHQVKWDDGGLCPHKGEPPYQSKERRNDSKPPPLQPGVPIPFTMPDGKVLDFVIRQIEYQADGITADLQDAESYERRHRWA